MNHQTTCMNCGEALKDCAGYIGCSPFGAPKDAPPPAALLLTVEDVAALLSVGPTTVKKLLADGSLPKVKIGRATRVRRSDVEKLVLKGAA